MFVSSVILFYYYGLRFDSKKPLPYDNGNKNAFLVSGLALFFLATICTVFIGGLYFPLVFKNSKALYMQTDEYKQQVSKYSEIDLSKKDKKEIKWLKKLEWISKNQYQQAITKLKNQTTG